VSIDLRTSYLGLELRSPIVASASPSTGEPGIARLLDEAGVGAIVLPSLFEEEILNDEIQLNGSLEAGSGQFAEALEYFPTVESFPGVGECYLALLAQIKAHATVPVIASLNAASAGGWVRYARLMQDAGADAVELNLYRVAADPRRTAAEMDAADLDLIAAVRASITIPLAIKLSPYYSALAHFAGQAIGRGADGLVLFNRFYQPDLDLETLEVVNRVELSHAADLRLPLRWIAILRPQLGPRVSLAASSGVHSGTDVVKELIVGADVAMMTSALLRHGPGHVRVVEAELRAWMAEHEYESVAQLRGSANQATVEDPSAFERANYMQTLHSWTTPPALTPTGSRGGPGHSDM
jgi:dihydroorotate dehydrogenase (fumarate)